MCPPIISDRYMSDSDFSELPKNHFGAILADPPWGFQCWDGKDKKVASRGSVTPYDTMDMDAVRPAMSGHTRYIIIDENERDEIVREIERLQALTAA